VGKVKIFYSYSHVDEKHRDELAKHLSILQRQGVIESWHDRRISAGTEWKDQIDDNLNKADLILLLISSDFLASDYCWDIELKRAIARHEDKKDRARVVPIILRSVDWSGAPFGKLQALPKDAKPIDSSHWHNLDEAFEDVAKGIRKVVGEINNSELTQKDAIQTSSNEDMTPPPSVPIRITSENTNNHQGENEPSLTLLHVSDMQFGKHHRFEEGKLLDYTLDDLKQGWCVEHDLKPDLIVVTGDLAEWGMKKEFDEALVFIRGLMGHFELGAEKVVIIPGNHDINRKLSEAHFLLQSAKGEEPQKPYWPKWKPFLEAFDDLYKDNPQFTFTEANPWTLFEFEDLKTVVCGLNSTMADSHLDGDHYGACTEEQYRWFSEKMREYERRGWYRIAAVHHNVLRGAEADDENLRDANLFENQLATQVNLILHGHTHDAKWGRLQNTIVVSTGSAALKPETRPNEVPNQYQILKAKKESITRYCRSFNYSTRRWMGDNRATQYGNGWIDTQNYQLENVQAVFPERRVARPRGVREDNSEGD